MHTHWGRILADSGIRRWRRDCTGLHHSRQKVHTETESGGGSDRVWPSLALCFTKRDASDMNDPAAVRTGSHSAGTSLVGPLGSTVHVLHADAGTIAELAAIDWSRHFRRVCLDPVRGLVTLMSPSFPHEDLATVLNDVVDAAGSLIAGATKGLRSTRLRGHDDSTRHRDGARLRLLRRRAREGLLRDS